MAKHIDEICQVVNRHALTLVEDPFANYVLQKIFECGTHQQKEDLVSTLSDRLYNLSFHSYGCWVMQKTVEFVGVDVNEMVLFRDNIKLTQT